MLDRFVGLQIFTAVARHGSFTVAADEVGVSRAMASKHIRALESRLGVRLFNRTTRSIRITEAGQTYLERATALLEDFDNLEAELVETQRALRGTLNIAAPPAFGAQYLAPVVASFMQQHEHIEVCLNLSDRRFDLIEESIDLEVTVRELEDSSFIARRLGEVTMMTCASPDYLIRCGIPRRPEQLDSHNCLIYSNNPAQMSADWQFQRRGKAFQIRVSGNFMSNVGDALCQHAISGSGIVRLPDYLVRIPVEAGTLVPVLENFSPPLRPVHALYPHRQFQLARVKQFLDFAESALVPE